MKRTLLACVAAGAGHAAVSQAAASDMPTVADEVLVFAAEPIDDGVTLADRPMSNVSIDVHDAAAPRSLATLDTRQWVTFTGDGLGAVTARQGECVVHARFLWPATPGAARTLVEVAFDSGDQVGVAVIDDTLQLYASFNGVYRHAFHRGLDTGPDNEPDEVAIGWSYADGYTLATLRVNGEETASLTSGLGRGTVSRVSLGTPAGSGKIDLEPLGWQRLELASAIRWAVEAEPIDVPVSARLIESRGGLTLWCENAARQVRLHAPLPDMGTTAGLEIVLARGETHAAQLVLTPQRAIDPVRVTWVESTAGGQRWPEGIVATLHEVGHVEVAMPSGRFGGAGLFPDPLPLLRGPLELRADENRAVWVSVSADRDTPPGVYDAELRIGHEARAWTVPVRVQVRRFALPRRPTLDTMARLNERFLPEDEAEAYYRSLGSHRITGLVGAQAIARLSHPNVSDAQVEAAEREIDLLIHELGIDTVTLPGIGWVSHRGTHLWPDGTTWHGVPHFTGDGSGELSARFRHSFGQFVRRMTDTLSSKAELSNFVFWYQDEMSWDDPLTLERSVAMARFLKQAAPGVKILQSKYPVPALASYTDIWCLHADHARQHESKWRQQQAQGDDVWIYHNTTLAIDYPTMRSRMFPWLLWNLGVDGSFSYWSINEWLEDPWTHPWSGIAGSGVLLYPPREGDPPGPVTSIRWEALRDGLEDVDYLAMLASALDADRFNADHAAKARSLLTEAAALGRQIPQVIGLGDQPYLLDVTRLDAMRHAIGDLLDTIADPIDQPAPAAPRES